MLRNVVSHIDSHLMKSAPKPLRSMRQITEIASCLESDSVKSCDSVPSLGCGPPEGDTNECEAKFLIVGVETVVKLNCTLLNYTEP